MRVRRIGDDLEVGLPLDQRSEALPYHGLLVDEHETYDLRSFDVPHPGFSLSPGLSRASLPLPRWAEGEGQAGPATA